MTDFKCRDLTPGQAIRIAFIGTKGVPAVWGGIEKYIEELGRRLVERGHTVTVFGSRWYCADYPYSRYKGMRIVKLPALHLQATDALTNGFFAALKIIQGEFDIAHFHGLASYYYVPLVRRSGTLTVTTTHAMESNWDNVKYNDLGRRVIRTGFDIGIRHADCVTTVARHLQIKLRTQFGIDASLLPSGLDRVSPQHPDIINKKYGLRGQDYLLFLGRVDPIKRIDWILNLRTVLDSGIRLVIAGGAQDPPTEMYLRELKSKAGDDRGILFTGPVAGREKGELISNCLLFLAPSADEGLPLTVLEAIAHRKCCVVSDLPAYKSILENGITGMVFDRNSQQAFLDTVTGAVQRPSRLDALGNNAHDQLKEKLDWDNTAMQAEKLYTNLLKSRKKR